MTVWEPEMIEDICPKCGLVREMLALRDYFTGTVVERMCVECWWTSEEDVNANRS